MAAGQFMPDDTYVHRMNDMENDAAFPFDDIILSGNVIPASTLQHLMPPLQVHMNLNYPYKNQPDKNSTDSENDYPNEPRNGPNNFFPPSLSRRIEMAETRKKKKKKKKKENKASNTTETDSEDEKTDIFRTKPAKKKPLESMCARSLELEHGWKQVLFPGFQILHKTIITPKPTPATTPTHTHSLYIFHFPLSRIFFRGCTLETFSKAL